MSNDDLFRNTLATNGLARGRATRPHKRKRTGLRFAVVILLLALACVVYFRNVAAAEIKYLDAVPEDTQAAKQFNDRLGEAAKGAAEVCVTLMERINGAMGVSLNTFPPYVCPKAPSSLSKRSTVTVRTCDPRHPR